MQESSLDFSQTLISFSPLGDASILFVTELSESWTVPGIK
jgi:hypothetical protein